MPAVFVHGVPETPAVWDGLRSHLHRDDVIALQLPGFGCPRPDGFGATKEEYVAWLVDELERIKPQGPIDLDRLTPFVQEALNRSAGGLNIAISGARLGIDPALVDAILYDAFGQRHVALRTAVRGPAAAAGPGCGRHHRRPPGGDEVAEWRHRW